MMGFPRGQDPELLGIGPLLHTSGQDETVMLFARLSTFIRFVPDCVPGLRGTSSAVAHL